MARGIIRSSIFGIVLLGASGVSAYAADLGPGSPLPPLSSQDWWSGFKFDAMINGGISLNPDDPINSIGNFGQLFTDKANEFLLNQILLTAHRDIDPKKDWDIGVKFQFMYGSDARYTHFLGELDHVTDDRNQLDIVENWIDFKTPWLGKGGMEIKVGQYPTLLGYEVIDPRGNQLYSHSYVFNSLPLKHTGILTTTHVSDALDIYAGADTGVNTTFGPAGDPNSSGAFLGGFALHLDKGNWNITTTTHIGPENAADNSDIRQYWDVINSYKINDKWLLVTDMDFIHDDITVGKFSGQNGWGLSQYVVYTANDWLGITLRGEFFRDPEGFYVAAFPCNLCFVDFESGNPGPIPGQPGTGRGTAIGAGPATYTELTLGFQIKPFSNSSKTWLKNALIRPEVRWDHSFDTNAFDNFTNNNQFTAASDFIVVFQ
jgi:hypothetical protein